MPEGDTIAWAANRLRPLLEGRVPDEILTPHPRHAVDRWPQRLAGCRVTSVESYGKHLFIHFEGGLVLHSHLRMTGSWRLSHERRRWPRAWLILRVGGSWIAQLGGPVLELMTEGRRRFDQRLAGLGPDVLSPSFDGSKFLRRLREDDPCRAICDALLDQRNVAGIGNIWKSEGCWETGIDPWRELREISDAEALAIIEAIRPRMRRSALDGPRAIMPRVYGRAGRPCPRCGSPVAARGQASGSARSPSGLATPGPALNHPADNRVTYWCPVCQWRRSSELAAGPEPMSLTK